MIEFLKDVVDDITILKILNNNTEASIFDLSCNKNNCLEIIKYMKEIGIEVIDDLLVYRLDWFLINKEEVVKRFSKYNIPVVVKLINDDYVVIDSLNF